MKQVRNTRRISFYVLGLLPALVQYVWSLCGCDFANSHLPAPPPSAPLRLPAARDPASNEPRLLDPKPPPLPPAIWPCGVSCGVRAVPGRGPSPWPPVVSMERRQLRAIRSACAKRNEPAGSSWLGLVLGESGECASPGVGLWGLSASLE